jgi:protein TonB
LNVSVSAEGRAIEVVVAQSSGHEDLDQAAMAAVSRWRFIPATRAGKPCAAAALVPILFRLED